MCPSKTSKESHIDPFLHGEAKFHVKPKPLPDNYYRKVEQDVIAASTMMKEGTERAKRIDIIGQNGNDGEHYDK